MINDNQIKKQLAGTYVYERLKFGLEVDKLKLAIVENSWLKYFLKTNRLRRRISKTRYLINHPSKWLIGGKL